MLYKKFGIILFSVHRLLFEPLTIEMKLIEMRLAKWKPNCSYNNNDWL